MKQLLVPLVFVLLLGTASAGQFNYSIELQESNALFTTIITLESKSPVNSFSLSGFFLPQNSEVISVKDTIGKIKNFSIEGNTISIKTNSGKARLKESIELKYLVKGFRKEEFSPLYFAEASLPAEKNSELEIEVKGVRVLSFETSPGFRGQVKDGVLKIAGSGPIGFWFFYSDRGKDYNHYILFNKSSYSDKELEERGLNEAEKLYGIIPQVIGVNLPFPKVPMLVLDEKEYSEKINSYSEGVYRTGGVIVISEREFEKNAAAVILHETTHAFNAQVMQWNESGAAWFDEGMAKFIEEYVRKLRGERKANLFNGKVSWVEGSYRYTIEPRGNLNDLVKYLEDRMDFMKEWDTGNESTREFGYAFSELYIREFVREKGIPELQKKYREMLKIKKGIKGRAEFSAKMTSLLGKELYPCDKQTELEIKECVDRLNEFTPGLPEKTPVLQLGLTEKEFNSVGAIQEMKKKILLEKIAAFREKMLEFTKLVLSGINAEKQHLLAVVGE